MKPRFVLLLALSSLAAQGACAMKGPPDVAARGSAAVGDTVSQTTAGVGGAVQAPLRDFNLFQDAIPVPLQRAIAHPYDSQGLETCEALLSAVGELDVVLGPDLDTPQETKHKDLYDKGASLAAQAALDAVKDTAEGVVPMKTWVRKLSGAASADIRARRAITAGMVRRSFLKGLGEMHNCAWPAAPLSFEPRKSAQVSPPPAAAAQPSPSIPATPPHEKN
jgi:hypothetical protein